MANDLDDTISASISLGSISTTASSTDNTISPDTDVDMFAFSVSAGQVVDFDIDTTTNGPGGLGSYMRLFNSFGQLLASNDNAAAPGENVVGFDAYLRHTFAAAGNYYLGVSNANNRFYNPITGSSDFGGGSNATGNYRLTVQALPIDNDDALSEAVFLGAISATPVTRSSTISPDIDVDMYRFTVNAGQMVDFDIDTLANGPGGLDSYLRLFNSLGQQLALNDDAAAPGETVVGFDAFLRHTFATAGTYYVGVSNFNNNAYNPITGTGDRAGGLNSIGAYQLTVQALAQDTDDTLNEAPSLGTISTVPVTRNSSITPDIDVDIFRFTVSAGQIVDFDIDTATNGPGGLGSYLRLFNSLGQQLAFNNDAAAPGETTIGFDAYLRHTFTVGGTYFIAVSNFNNISYNPLTGSNDTAGGLHSTGAYQLTVQSPTASPTDPDDTISEAIALGTVSTTPLVTSGDISPDFDVDMLRFNASAGQIVDFNLNTLANGPGGLNSYLRLFNSLGQQLAFNDNAAAPGETVVGFDAFLRHTFATTGTYYIAVSNFNNIAYDPITGLGDRAGGLHSIGAYQLSVQGLVDDTDDAISEATSLGVITAVPVTRNSSITPDVDVDMYSFAASAGQVVDFDIDTATNGPGGLGSYLRLFNSQGQQLAFNNDAAAPGEPTVGFDAYLRHTFSVGGTYFIAVSNLNNINFNPLTGGNDTAGGLHSTGAYQLTVQTPAASPTDPDDTISEAVALGTVSTTPLVASGNISPDFDVDMLRFNADSGQVVDFDIDTLANGPGGLNSYLRLFNSLGQQLAVNDNAAAPGEGAVGFDAYLRFTITVSGTYYVAISNANNNRYDPVSGGGDISGGSDATGVYQLTVQALAVDADDTQSEATSLGAITTVPIVRSSSITPDTDVDMYSFTASAGQVVDFDIDTATNGPGGLGSYLRLFNSLGQQLAFNNDAAAPGETTIGFDAYLRHTFTVGGTYFIAVSNLNNINYDPRTGDNDTAGGLHSIGSYQLIVQEVSSDSDDTIAEATPLGVITASPITRNASISTDIDVDMYSLSVNSGQVVDFDVDTAVNGPGALGGYLRLFNAQGQVLAVNDNAAAPGEATVGFDPYLRHTFTVGGTYFIAVSNFNNIAYNPLTGANDTAGGLHSIGAYQLTVTSVVPTSTDPDDTISEAVPLGTVSIVPLVATGNIFPDIDVDMLRFAASAGQVVDFDIDTTLNGPGGLGSFLRLFNSLGQQLALNDNAAAPGEGTVGFDAYLRYRFPVGGTYFIGISNSNNSAYNPNTGEGDRTGGANATGSYRLTVRAVTQFLIPTLTSTSLTESGETVHNTVNPLDTNNDGVLSPLDALLVINYLNVVDPTDVSQSSLPTSLDVNSDNFVSSIDALLVINALNTQALAEGETALAPPTDQFKRIWEDAVDQVFAEDLSEAALAVRRSVGRR